MVGAEGLGLAGLRRSGEARATAEIAFDGGDPVSGKAKILDVAERGALGGMAQVFDEGIGVAAGGHVVQVEVLDVRSLRPAAVVEGLLANVVVDGAGEGKAVREQAVGDAPVFLFPSGIPSADDLVPAGARVRAGPSGGQQCRGAEDGAESYQAATRYAVQVHLSFPFTLLSGAASALALELGDRCHNAHKDTVAYRSGPLDRNS